MKRAFAIGLAAIVAAAQAWALEPEPIETHPIPDRGTIYPPPSPDDPTPPPVDIIIGDDGELTTDPPGYELPYGDNGFETAYEAMLAALKTARSLMELQASMETFRALVNAALREQDAQIEANKCKCEDSGEDTELFYDASVDLDGDGALTVGVDVHFAGQEAAFKTQTANFAKIAVSGQLKDAKGSLKDISDYSTCYNEAKADWMATILSYHDGQATPTVITNFNPVAFSGDYNDLTNTPSIKVESMEEGGDGSGYKITLVTGGGEEEDDGSMPLAKIAISGSWNDLKDIPERATNCYTKAETDALIEEARCKCEGGDTPDPQPGGGCDCQIKTAGDVRAVEEDPEAIPLINALETRVAKLEDDMREASTRIAVLEEAVGKKATIGIMPEPGTLD